MAAECNLKQAFPNRLFIFNTSTITSLKNVALKDTNVSEIPHHSEVSENVS
jgi:hypothetical protein